MDKYKIYFVSSQNGYMDYEEEWEGTEDEVKERAWQEVKYPYHIIISDKNDNQLWSKEFWRNPNGNFGWEKWKQQEYKF